MSETIRLGELAIAVTRKDIKHVHLSVHPPSGRVTLVAPTGTRLAVTRAYAASKLSWIRQQHPLYMSPEAVKSPNRVDASSDIYSLGAVAYELLTGQTVFSGSTVGEVMVRQVQELPETPSDRMRRPVAADFEELLMKCLEKKPAGRPASAAALEEALGRCAASGAWTRQDAADWWARFAAAQSAKTTVLPAT